MPTTQVGSLTPTSHPSVLLKSSHLARPLVEPLFSGHVIEAKEDLLQSHAMANPCSFHHPFSGIYTPALALRSPFLGLNQRLKTTSPCTPLLNWGACQPGTNPRSPI